MMREEIYCFLVSLETQAIKVIFFSCEIVGCVVTKPVSDMTTYYIQEKEDKLIK